MSEIIEGSAPTNMTYDEAIQFIGSLEDKNREQANTIRIMREALESVDIYFKTLIEQWAANDGRVVSESGTIIEGSADVERLCEVAAMKVREALQSNQGDKETGRE